MKSDRLALDLRYIEPISIPLATLLITQEVRSPISEFLCVHFL
jgi:hypothetical protein